MKRNFGKLLIATVSVFVAGTCLPGFVQAASSVEKGTIAKLETIKGNYMANLRSEALQAKNSTAGIKATGPASAWMTKVNASQVNMVTNRVEKQAQSEIKMDGKSYFASGDAYAMTMNQNPSLRFSKDPLTNKVIDKSEAVIFADASGSVLYFENEESFKSFVGLASSETVYGYSEPK